MQPVLSAPGGPAVTDTSPVSGEDQEQLRARRRTAGCGRAVPGKIERRLSPCERHERRAAALRAVGKASSGIVTRSTAAMTSSGRRAQSRARASCRDPLVKRSQRGHVEPPRSTSETFILRERALSPRLWRDSRSNRGGTVPRMAGPEKVASRRHTRSYALAAVGASGNMRWPGGGSRKLRPARAGCPIVLKKPARTYVSRNLRSCWTTYDER